MQRTHFDYWLLFSAILLSAAGIVMVYSSSAVLAADRYGDTYYFLKKELFFVVIGIGVTVCMARIPYGVLRHGVYPLLAVTLGLVLLTYVPGLRAVASGAARWLHLGPITFQPSEILKVAFVIFMAYSLEKKIEKIDRFGVGVLPHLAIAGLACLLVLGQRDFGAAFVIGSMLMIMLFAGGVRPLYLTAIGLLTLPFAYYAIAGMPYRRQRILAFLDPWSDRYGSGFQIIQSLISFHQGGVWGRGLGEGQQKLFYLPEAHTDFIAAVLGEELGLVGVLAIILLFAIFAMRGLIVAWRAPDLFGRYLALGLTTLVAWQALANLSVVMGLLPTKGMVLPFISYGGSSLLITFFTMGILFNVSTFRRGPNGSLRARGG
ncbi:MAG: putative lipid II flippase FtsW [Deltaproteobacteria bacterium]|nr:putative lipid II flippase FtsW [Deltaproteobacteria bacterium]